MHFVYTVLADNHDLRLHIDLRAYLLFTCKTVIVWYTVEASFIILLEKVTLPEQK